MRTLVRNNLVTILGVALCFFAKSSTGQGKTEFLNKYDLFYFDNAGTFTRNGKVVEKGGDKFTPDILFSDGSVLSSYSEAIDKLGKGKASLSEIIHTSTSLNQNKLFFQGRVYESYQGSESALRDGNFIYYLKCVKLEYNQSRNGNCCTRTALYANDDEIDEADFLSDAEISMGVSNITPLFVSRGILYFTKTVGDKGDYYAYDPIKKSTTLYKPDIFRDNENAMLAILDNGDIVFSNSSGVFKNSLDSKIIGGTKMEYALIQGIAIDNNYYYLMRLNPNAENGGQGLFKDNLLVSRIHSDTYGKMIDAYNQDCHFGNYIYTYLTSMYCIHKSGIVVRLDRKAKAKKVQTAEKPATEWDIEYVVNDDPIDFSRYWTTDGKLEKAVLSVSFVFNEKGDVSDLVVNAPGKDGFSTNIYLVRFLGDGKIGSPELLVSNATLFGAVKKSSKSR